jgi:hypothetical protein
MTQPLDADAEVPHEDDERVTRAREWLGAFREAGIPPSTKTVPYPGLRAFRTHEIGIFFARDGQIKALQDSFAGRTKANSNHILVVTGGSASGKSSIVMAGLLARLPEINLRQQGGGCFVVNMRPGRDAAASYVQSVTRTMCDAIIGREEQQNPREFVTRVMAAWPGDWQALDGQGVANDAVFRRDVEAEIERRVRQSLWRPLEWGVKASANARRRLMRFVDKTIDAIDLALKPLRSGPPTLLIYIDQFEEIFRDADKEATRQGREMIFELLRMIDRDRPSALFAVLSMRSEELHKCSEAPGLADIVNRSMHLVDLVQPADIEPAIHLPAQRFLIGRGFEPTAEPTWPYHPDTVARIMEAYSEAFERQRAAAEHTADALPLLQHFLRRLWTDVASQWAEAVEKSGQPVAFPLIGPERLDKFEAWNKPGEATRLSAVLNADANDCFEAALEAWLGALGRTPNASDKTKAGDTLKAALVSLGTRDQQGRLVRSPRTLQEMIEFARPDTSSGRPANELLEPLRQALQVFHRRSLIDIRNTERDLQLTQDYDVYHESLFRNWGQYREWLNQARNAARALADLANALKNEEEAKSVGQDAHERALKDTNKKADAAESQLAPVVGSIDDRSGSPGWAGTRWMYEALKRYDAPMPSETSKENTGPLAIWINTARKRAADERQRVENQRYELEREKRSGQRNKNLLLVAGCGLVMFAFVVQWAWSQLYFTAWQRNLAYLMTAANQAIVTQPGPNRQLGHELDMWLMHRLVEKSDKLANDTIWANPILERPARMVFGPQNTDASGGFKRIRERATVVVEAQLRSFASDLVAEDCGGEPRELPPVCAELKNIEPKNGLKLAHCVQQTPQKQQAFASNHRRDDSLAIARAKSIETFQSWLAARGLAELRTCYNEGMTMAVSLPGAEGGSLVPPIAHLLRGPTFEYEDRDVVTRRDLLGRAWQALYFARNPTNDATVRSFVTPERVGFVLEWGSSGTRRQRRVLWTHRFLFTFEECEKEDSCTKDADSEWITIPWTPKNGKESCSPLPGNRPVSSQEQSQPCESRVRHPLLSEANLGLAYLRQARADTKSELTDCDPPKLCRTAIVVETPVQDNERADQEKLRTTYWQWMPRPEAVAKQGGNLLVRTNGSRIFKLIADGGEFRHHFSARWKGLSSDNNLQQLEQWGVRERLLRADERPKPFEVGAQDSDKNLFPTFADPKNRK